MTTRRKAPTQPPVEEPKAVEMREYREPAAFNPAGCMIPIMFFMMMGMMAFMVWDRSQSPATPVAPVVVPVADLSAFTAPITAKLATDQAKAARVESAYIGLRDALAGPAGQRVTDSRIFESVSRAFLTDLDAKGGVSVGTEIDNAIGAYLGMTKSTEGTETGWEPMQFDAVTRSKLIAIVGAIATAVGGVR
jgi:hypothetical protein